MDGQIIKQTLLAYGSPIRIAVVLLATFAVILIGQAGRELLPPDDLREAEVAREMYIGGDYIIPHLAGIPFIEKPSGFPFAVMTAYKIAGRPSETAARLTSVFFAFISLMFVFLLGHKVLGVEGGAFSAAILGLSMRFSRTAHEILLDNALTAMVAAAVFFSWIALDTGDPKKEAPGLCSHGFCIGSVLSLQGNGGSGRLCFRVSDVYRFKQTFFRISSYVFSITYNCLPPACSKLADTVYSECPTGCHS